MYVSRFAFQTLAALGLVVLLGITSTARSATYSEYLDELQSRYPNIDFHFERLHLPDIQLPDLPTPPKPPKIEIPDLPHCRVPDPSHLPDPIHVDAPGVQVDVRFEDIDFCHPSPVTIDWSDETLHVGSSFFDVFVDVPPRPEGIVWPSFPHSNWPYPSQKHVPENGAESQTAVAVKSDSPTEPAQDAAGSVTDTGSGLIASEDLPSVSPDNVAEKNAEIEPTVMAKSQAPAESAEDVAINVADGAGNLNGPQDLSSISPDDAAENNAEIEPAVMAKSQAQAESAEDVAATVADEAGDLSEPQDLSSASPDDAAENDAEIEPAVMAKSQAPAESAEDVAANVADEAGDLSEPQDLSSASPDDAAENDAENEPTVMAKSQAPAESAEDIATSVEAAGHVFTSQENPLLFSDIVAASIAEEEARQFAYPMTMSYSTMSPLSVVTDDTYRVKSERFSSFPSSASASFEMTQVDGSSVPEPASIVMWSGLGVMGLFAARRRRRAGRRCS